MVEIHVFCAIGIQFCWISIILVAQVPLLIRLTFTEQKECGNCSAVMGSPLVEGRLGNSLQMSAKAPEEYLNSVEESKKVSFWVT